MTIADQLYEQVRQLPEPLVREALEWRDLMNAQNAALADTRDNEADEAWNNV
jgi:hypothetical protein